MASGSFQVICEGGPFDAQVFSLYDLGPKRAYFASETHLYKYSGIYEDGYYIYQYQGVEHG